MRDNRRLKHCFPQFTAFNRLEAWVTWVVPSASRYLLHQGILQTSQRARQCPVKFLTLGDRLLALQDALCALVVAQVVGARTVRNLLLASKDRPYNPNAIKRATRDLSFNLHLF